MSFVNEFVPEDQKDKFDPEVFNLGPAFPPVRPYRWVIDRERNIFLILTGRQGSGGGDGDGYIPPEFFTFSFQKQLIKFEAEITASRSKDGGWALNWFVINLKIPPSLQPKREDILKELIDAIKTHGTSTGTPDSRITSINIDFK